MFKKIYSVLLILGLISGTAYADTKIATSQYVENIVTALGVPALTEKLSAHVMDSENPHSVTAEQIGLGNVQNVDQTNADNLTSGTVNIARLPVGTGNENVASGADIRFDSLPTTAPTGTPPSGRVYVWFVE